MNIFLKIMEISSDPYEQKLYHMFKSYDIDCCGALDEKSLIKLCNSLELKDKSIYLVQSMLKDNNCHRVTFKDFKDALLNFLGNEMDEDKNLIITQNETSTNHKVPDSPGREVSPKLVVGAKKYGRRSRPQSLVIDSSDSSDNEMCAVVPNVINKTSYKVQRSSSQSDITLRKRRPGSGGTKLKRCASLPAQQQRIQKTREQKQLQQQSPNTPEQQKQLTSSVESLGNLDFDNLSQKIYDIWENYGNELGTYLLNRIQLEIICKRIGLINKIAIKVAEEVFEKLNLKDNDKISYDEFIGLIQSDTTTTTTTTTTNKITTDYNLNDDDDDDDNNNDNNNYLNIKKNITTAIVSANSTITTPSLTRIVISDVLQTSPITTTTATTLDNRNFNHNLKDASLDDLHVKETLSSENIIEMWQSAGVNDPRLLLSSLGFDDEKNIFISHLLSTLEEEIRGLSGDSQVSVLKATLILRKFEITTLQQNYRQIIEENKKLRSDCKDANKRAAMLAQEIDERHASLEDTTKSEIRLLEQRHAEVIRELTSQLSNDREHWSQLNSRLESRIKQLEQDELRYKLELQTINDENSALENEQISLQKQITDLLETNIKLNNEIVELEDKQRNDDGNTCEKNTEEMLELIDKITSLQIENSNLRDKNDELVADIENLNIQLNRYKNKNKNSRTNIPGDVTLDDTEQTFLGGIKRRGDSPSKIRISEESPRLGKLRKCNDDGNNSESDTSGDWVALNSEMMNSTMNNQANVAGITTTTTTTTNVVTTPSSSSGFSQDFSSISAIDNKDDEINILKEKIQALENELNELRKQKNQMNVIVKENADDKDNIKTENDKDNKESDNKKCVNTDCDDDVIDYTLRCQELENSLEQMRKAYEDCEDYWQAKLNEERQLFEKERQIYEEVQDENDKKFTELMEKVREYEEQFDKEGRLSPIQEKDNLEQQYADLEAEIDEIKNNSQKIFEEKTKEIINLQQQIKELKDKLGEDIIDKIPDSLNIDLKREAIDIESPASSPISYLWNQSTIQTPARDYQNPQWNSKPKIDGDVPSETIKQESGQNLSPTSPSTITAPTCISPIQKPNSKNNSNIKNEQDEIESNSSSGKSYETHSVASTHSVHKSSVSSDDSNHIKEDLKRLKYVEVQLKEQIKDLAHKRDGLVMELQQLHEAKPVLEKAYARTAHPTLIQRVNQLELKNRHLQNVIRQQQQYTESIMHQSWQQQRQEIIELRNRLEQQGMLITQQAQRLANSDILVKDLYVENSHLTATIQRLEQQRNRAALMHQHQGLTN